MSRRPRVTILLCTYNGAAYLSAQLESYVTQEHSDWDLWVSDDGSHDATEAIVADFRTRHGKSRQIRWIEGPRRGVAANFLSLLCHPELPEGPVALSDQDDVWLPQKLGRALDHIGTTGNPVSLYGAQSLHVDTNLRTVGRSKPTPRSPSFRNALAQNIISGHTSVLSPGALRVVRQFGMVQVVWHDWWLYQLVTGVGGTVVIDREAVALYRQHDQATMGAHQGQRASLIRIKQLFGHRYGFWIRANMAALCSRSDLLDPDAYRLLTALRAARRGPQMAWKMMHAGVHRQGATTTTALYLATLLGRV